jgi:lipopolysaccharide/colanic/teichoic acid biosynthesis glycosyltransferase
MQRFLDILLSGLALLALMPLLVPVVVILRLTGEREVFFRQERIGLGGRPFGLLKFATMLKDSPNIGPGTITVKDDPRVLPFGRFLRKTKLNELPQLVNIVKGDMSLIGPRPQTRRCFHAFPAEARAKIVEVRPGLSGIGSIVFRGEEEMYGDTDNPDRLYDEVIMPYKGELERWYVNHQTLGNYFLLILLTVLVVLRPHSRVLWRVFPDLPRAPAELQDKIPGPW